MNSDLQYWLALNENPKFGPRAFKKLAAHFPNMKEAFYAPASEIKAAGLFETHATGFVHMRDDIHPERVLKAALDKGFKPLTIEDDSYPALLKEIYDPPGVIYVHGHLPTSDMMHLGIVGSRRATPYGLRNARAMSRELAKEGIVIVSGLAYGVDEAAHLGAIEAGGLTVAVMACGLLQLDSRQRYVTEKIVASGGSVISEFPLNSPSLKHYFPYRNRVISGMSNGTLVVEAAEKSGSLITARTSLEQDREVFAIPGPIHVPTSKGTNNLIKQGAHVVTESKDILEVLEIDSSTPRKPEIKPTSEEEEKLLELLSKTPIHINELIRSTGLEGATVAGTLSVMEIQGHVQQIGGMYYILI